MINIWTLMYSDPRLNNLSLIELKEYDDFLKSGIEDLLHDKNISEDEIILVTKSLIEIFFKTLEQNRRKKSKIK